MESRELFPSVPRDVTKIQVPVLIALLLTFIGANGCAGVRTSAGEPSGPSGAASASTDVNVPIPYFRLGPAAELNALNEQLREYRFTRYHFDNPGMVIGFLAKIKDYVRAHVDPNVRGIPSHYLGYERNSSWLRGTQTSEAILIDLSRDPDVVLNGNDWTIISNMFRADGGVDQWRLTGAHDPQANINRITHLDVARLKPAGTFRYPYQND
jgi:hypothetical protein